MWFCIYPISIKYCTNICIIQNGTIVDTGSIKKFKQNKETEFIFEVNDTSIISNIIKDVKIIDERVFSKTIEKEKIPELIKKLVDNNVLIYEVRLRELTLEEAFLNKAGGNKID